MSCSRRRAEWRRPGGAWKLGAARSRAPSGASYGDTTLLGFEEVSEGRWRPSCLVPSTFSLSQDAEGGALGLQARPLLSSVSQRPYGDLHLTGGAGKQL